jgi:predicted nucleic acid-binding protein
MRIIIAVDANIILSALLGGKPSSILFDPRFYFITTNFTLKEVEKYIPRLAKKLNLPEADFKKLLSTLPISSYSKKHYTRKIKEAKALIEEIDKKDVDILALALQFDAHLWSQDKDFETAGYLKILKTYNFIE